MEFERDGSMYEVARVLWKRPMGVSERYVLAAKHDLEADETIFFCDMERFVYRCWTVAVYDLEGVRRYIDRQLEWAVCHPGDLSSVGLEEVMEAMGAALEAFCAEHMGAR